MLIYVISYLKIPFHSRNLFKAENHAILLYRKLVVVTVKLKASFENEFARLNFGKSMQKLPKAAESCLNLLSKKYILFQHYLHY